MSLYVCRATTKPKHVKMTYNTIVVLQERGLVAMHASNAGLVFDGLSQSTHLFSILLVSYTYFEYLQIFTEVFCFKI